MSETTLDQNPVSGHDEPTRAEPDSVNMAFIGIFVAGLLLVLVILVVGILNFFTLQTTSILNEKVHSVVDPEIGQVRNAEENKLYGYRWVNEEEGVVQIPINQAAELVLADWDSRVEAAQAAAAQTAEEGEEAQGDQAAQ